jgi:glucose/arabinose dehydrogenase
MFARSAPCGGGVLLLSLAVASAAGAAGLPPGFTETQVAAGLSSPTAMALAPDGRVFVCQQNGQLRVVKEGELLEEPFLTLPVDSAGERGLLGVAFDPDFAVNSFVYVYYTATGPTVHNRISRFTASGDVAVPGSETVLLDLSDLGSTIHNGGALHFGPDGKLYVAVGENAVPSNAQTLGNLLGKVLRIDKDGTIPDDNPFSTQASGVNRAIWALGLRNPFTFAFQAGTGRMLINDVGANAWEEIDDGVAASNYGWPATEGPTSDPRFRGPLYAYPHAAGVCAVTGGTFYDPASPQFPAEYEGKYLFSDFCAGWIRTLDPDTGAVADFASGISFPVDLRVDGEGRLYYLARGSGSVWRVEFTGDQAPRVTSHPQGLTVSAGQPASFAVTASGTAPLGYQWQRDGADIPGATSSTYTLAAAALADDGAAFRVVVTNSFGSVTSNDAVLTVTANTVPVATITAPATGTLYSAGDVVAFAGMGTDAEDGALPPGALTWQVDFHHDTHAHPFMAPTSGITGGSFVIPTTGETSANVWYRVYLTVRDSGGLTHTAYSDVVPRKVTLTLASSPAGLPLTLDGQPVTTPYSVQGVVGMQRVLGAPSPQTVGPNVYELDAWSDGGAGTHAIATPAADVTYTASYHVSGAAPGLGLLGTYFDNPDFTGPAVTRLDAAVNFEWGSASPIAGIGADTFSVRWQGHVRAKVSGVHTFYTVSDDGVRLYVNGQLLIDNWTDHAATENTGTITLTAGQKYSIRMETYDNGGWATAKLLWSAPGLAKEVVPQTHLHPWALLVAGSVNPLSPADAAVKARLESQGHVVIVQPAAVATTLSATGQSIVLVSATVTAADVGTKFSAVVNPVVTWESQLFDDLGLTGTSAGTDFGTLAGQTTLNVVVGGVGPAVVTTSPAELSWGVPNGNAWVVARTMDSAAAPAFFVYEKGAAMFGRIAPGRRGGLFLGNETAASLNSSGWSLFDSAVRWARGR